MMSSFAEATVKEKVLKELYKAYYEKDAVRHSAPSQSFHYALWHVALF